ncbi:retrotransposon protein, putative, ty1-copia subclass [Tanacetum coccineum]
MLQDVKSWLGKCFSMKDLGEAAYILGIKIYRDRLKRLIGLSQNAYIDKILKQLKMDASKRGNIPMQPNVDLSKTQGPSTPAEVKQMKGVPYASTIGSIMYAVRCTRPDVAFSQNLTNMFLVYGGDSTTELSVTCYNNADWETDRDDLRSQMGYVFVMNVGVVDLKSSKQSTTAMSSTEAEYIAAFEATIEAIWIRKRECFGHIHLARILMDDAAKLICCSLDEHWTDPTYEYSLHGSASNSKSRKWLCLSSSDLRYK